MTENSEENRIDFGFDNVAVCSPIDTVKQLYEKVENPPSWTRKVIPLKQRSQYAIKNTSRDCHVNEDDFAPRERIRRASLPKTLICHDMKGGYLLDKYVDGVNKGNGFTFHRWAHTDIFCYFSHHFITIPPLSWTNLAHTHGNAVIGTMITENQEGAEICNRIFNDKVSYKTFADALIKICVLYKFDGWLINVENAVQKPYFLLDFVKYLTEGIHKEIPWGYIIWYDSVTKDGKLHWQNELNDLNKCYFDVCDGIFLNYQWDEKQMWRTKKIAGDRFLDVYVGIDVWGRGSYGGGEFNAHKAAEVIESFKMSMAIFGHGWVHEKTPEHPSHDFLKRYYSRSSLFWKLLYPFMYTTPIDRPFKTAFKTGVTSTRYDLSLQEVQPSCFPSHALTTETRFIRVSEEVCRCVQERLLFDDRLLLISNKGVEEPRIIHRIFSTDIRLSKETRIDVFTYAYEETDADYALVLLVENEKGKLMKIVGTSKVITMTTNDINVSPVTYIDDEDDLGVPRHWERRRFDLSYPGCRLLEVGIKLLNDNYLYLCEFSIQT